MVDVLQTALAWLDGKQKTHQAQAVTYYRGSDSVTVTTTPGSSERELTDLEEGLTHRIDLQDWLIEAADLIIGGSVVEPQAGDRVHFTIGSVTYEHEVVELPGEPCFKYTSPYKMRLRVHSKLVAES